MSRSLTYTSLQQAYHSTTLIWEVAHTSHQAGGVEPGAAIACQPSNEQYQPERGCYEPADTRLHSSDHALQYFKLTTDNGT